MIDVALDEEAVADAKAGTASPVMYCSAVVMAVMPDTDVYEETAVPAGLVTVQLRFAAPPVRPVAVPVAPAFTLIV